MKTLNISLDKKMSTNRGGGGGGDKTVRRSCSELSDIGTIRFGIDLVSAARKNIGFLRNVAESQWIHSKSTLLEATRRYDELWMPLICDLTLGLASPPVMVPPFDIEWVWFCHTLNPRSYKQYCFSKFSKLIGKPAIFNYENEEYALMRCKAIWNGRYPSEPFENEIESESDLKYSIAPVNEDLLNLVLRQEWLHSTFIKPYMSEIVYLIAARHRYKEFLCLMKRFGDGCSSLVPTSDVLLMLLTHQSYPTVYAGDTNHMGEEIIKVLGSGEHVKKSEVEETKKLWERTYNYSHQKAGGESHVELDRLVSIKSPFYWEVVDTDVNTRYKSMVPRFLLEVCVFVKLKSYSIKAKKLNPSCDFMRARVIRCHKELKLNKPISTFSLDSWEKACHFYCEFGTRGVVMELYKNGSHWFKGSNLQDSYGFHWNDLLRSSTLTLGRELDQLVMVETSITPPVQAPYLLKCVPDKVTDDSGAMISDVILKMNNYRPQEGRWLSRTVLDHAGRECFVIRMRVGGGFWRRGGETPLPVKWEDRIIEIRVGSWSYVGGSIGRAPVKVVGTATPKEPPEPWNASWCFSSGDELMIKWDSSTSLSGPVFQLNSQSSLLDSSLRLLKGRRLQYRVKKITSEGKKGRTQLKEDENEEQEEDENEEQEEDENEEQEEDEDDDHDEEEEGFVTLVRFTEDNPTGRATALLNWKLLVVELLPEEDAAFVLLLCISILRSVSEKQKEDIGNLLIRRRMKEVKLGARDWGSVILHHSSYHLTKSSPHLQPWYWNAKAVMAPADRSTDGITRQSSSNYSPVEGGDKLYKRAIITHVRE